MTPDYHDYVIKDGQFIGKFEEMYQECDDPWEASKENYDSSSCSLATKRFIYMNQIFNGSSVLSLGSGKGNHLKWLDVEASGVEISLTAVELSRKTYPQYNIFLDSIIHFMKIYPYNHDIYLFREVLWYILPDWQAICDILKAKHQGALIIVELSFYDDQQYGNDYFNGPDEFICKWPFTIEKIVREHSTKQQREGRLMVAGRIV